MKEFRMPPTTPSQTRDVPLVKESTDAPVNKGSGDAPTDKDVFIISSEINYTLFEEISHEIRNREKNGTKQENCLLILTTPGGDPNAGYRIARCFQKKYKSIRLVVASFCKSAGTLMAIAANEIAIGPLGELGPLDIQVLKKDEFGDFSSGLDIIEAMEAIAEHTQKFFARQLVDLRLGTRISTRLAGELAAKITSSVATPLYSQIDPQRVAEMQRAMSIALKYGQILGTKSRSLKSDALEKLVRDYPTHSFVIDEEEAKLLFNNIEVLTEEEELLIESLWNFVRVPKKEEDSRPRVIVDSYESIIEKIKQHGKSTNGNGTPRNKKTSKVNEH